MYKLLLIFLFGYLPTMNAQNKITFNYDSSGNQIIRKLCINCQTGKTVDEVKEIEAITDQDLSNFSAEDYFSYYPNPVKEELYLKWNLETDNQINSVYIYNINGTTLQSFLNLNKVQSLNIPFQNYPLGVYIISLSYTNGDQKTIKIIKQ